MQIQSKCKFKADANSKQMQTSPPPAPGTHSHGFGNRVNLRKGAFRPGDPGPLQFPPKRNAMLSLLRALFHDEPGSTKAKIISIYALLAGFNLGAWIWALAAFHRYPVLLGTAFLAYSFGLRHAVDADHIAAIDNVTRKLMQQDKRPTSVGLLFSLGHSTIVVIGSVAIAAAAMALQHRMDAVKNIGSLIGTLVSAFFLFAIAIVNLIVLLSIYRSFRRVRRGEPFVDEDFDMLLGSRGRS